MKVDEVKDALKSPTGIVVNTGVAFRALNVCDTDMSQTPTYYYRSDTVFLMIFMVSVVQQCAHVAASLAGWWAATAYAFCLLFLALLVTLAVAAEEEKGV